MPTPEPAGSHGVLPPDVAGRLADFTGRRWALRRIAAWRHASTSPSLLITAGPGGGKTALAGRLLQVSAGTVRIPGVSGEDCRIDAANFCDQRTFASVDPVRVLERLGDQLAETVPGYGAQLLSAAGRSTGNITVRQRVPAMPGAVVSVQGVVINLGDRNPRRAYDEIIRRPLQRLRQGGGGDVVILIDALNEAEAAAGSTGTMSLGRLLGMESEDPVPGLRMILTSSRGTVEHELGGHDHFDLVADEPQDSSDVYDYAFARLAGRVARADQLAQRIALVDGGNFLYARYVVDDLLTGRLSADQAAREPLPENLANVYATFLWRERNRDPAGWSQRMRPLLAALTQGRGEGLTRDQLARVTELRVSVVDDTLRACARYLQGTFPQGPFRPFHASFTTFLLTNGEHVVYPAEAAGDLVDRLIRPWVGRWDACEPSTLRYAVEHMVEAITQQSDGPTCDDLTRLLIRTLRDPGYLLAMAARHGVESLLVAVDQATRATPELARSLDPVHSVLSRQIGALLDLDVTEDAEVFLSQIQLEAAAQGETTIVAAVDTFRAGRAWQGLRVLHGKTWESPWLRVSLVGHTRGLTNVAVADDSRHAVTTSYDSTARVWDLLTGRQLQVLEHGGVPFHVEAGDRFAVTGAEDGVVRLWDMATGRLRHEFTPDGPASSGDPPLPWVLRLGEAHSSLVTGWNDGHVRIWDVHTGDALHDFAPPPGGRDLPEPVTAIDVDWDRGRLVSGHMGGRVAVWELGRPKPRRMFQFRANGRFWIDAAHHGDVVACLFLPDSRRVITAGNSWEGTVRVWDPARKGPLAELRGTMREVARLQLIDDGRTAVALSAWGTIETWNLDTFERSVTFTPPGQTEGREFDEAAVCALAPDHAIVSLHTGSMTVIDLRRATVLGELTTPGAVRAVAVTRDGLRMVTASTAPEARVWRLDPEGAAQRQGRTTAVYGTATWPTSEAFDLDESYSSDLEFTPDEDTRVTAAEDAVRVWDTDTGQQRFALFEMDLEHHGQPCWREETHERVLVRDHMEGDWYSACPDEFAAFTVGDFRRDSGSYCRHQVHTCEEDGRPLRTDRPVRVAVLPDARTAVAVQADGAITTFGVYTGTVRRRLPGGLAGTPALQTGGRTLLAAWPESLRSWDWRSGRPLLSLDEPLCPWTIALSAGGTRAMVATPDGSVLMWPTREPRAMLRWQTHLGELTACALGDGGSFALTAAAGTLTLWDVSALPDQPRAISALFMPGPVSRISPDPDDDLTFTVDTGSSGTFTIRAVVR